MSLEIFPVFCGVKFCFADGVFGGILRLANI